MILLQYFFFVNSKYAHFTDIFSHNFGKTIFGNRKTRHSDQIDGSFESILSPTTIVSAKKLASKANVTNRN